MARIVRAVRAHTPEVVFAVANAHPNPLTAIGTHIPANDDDGVV